MAEILSGRCWRVSDEHHYPKVGIFWLFGGKLLSAGTPMDSEAPVCGFVDYPEGHINVWEGYQQKGLVPQAVEYEEPPRGRVLYKVIENRFIVYADRCILSDPKLMSEIQTRFDLPAERTVMEADEQYACAACLSGHCR